MDYRWLFVFGGGALFWLLTVGFEYAMGERPTHRQLDGAKAPRKSKRSTGSPRK